MFLRAKDFCDLNSIRISSKEGGVFMTFTNGYNGVKKVFAAEILTLIVSVLSAVTLAIGIVSATGLLQEDGDINTGAFAMAGIAGILVIVTMVLMIIALILELVGLGQAGKDEPMFKSAFILSIFSLVLSLANGILKAFVNDTNSVLDDVVALVQRIFAIVVVFLVIAGIQSFAQKLGDEKMAKKAKSVSWLIAIPYLLGAIASLLPGIFGANNVSNTIAVILAIVGGVLTVIGSIVYLVYIGQAKKMLREN